MDENKKKVLMIGIVVVCLVLAVVITLRTRGGRSGSIESISAGEKIWVKCANQQCGATYEIGKKEFYAFLKEHINPMAMGDPPMPCKECKKDSVYVAVKCEKCGNIFFKNANKPDDYQDRCPKCKYSKQEQERNPAAVR